MVNRRCETTPPNIRVVARHLFAALAAVKQGGTKKAKAVRMLTLLVGYNSLQSWRTTVGLPREPMGCP